MTVKIKIEVPENEFKEVLQAAAAMGVDVNEENKNEVYTLMAISGLCLILTLLEWKLLGRRDALVVYKTAKLLNTHEIYSSHKMPRAKKRLTLEVELDSSDVCQIDRIYGKIGMEGDTNYSLMLRWGALTIYKIVKRVKEEGGDPQEPINLSIHYLVGDYCAKRGLPPLYKGEFKE
jgi:hypothetical protein